MQKIMMLLAAVVLITGCSSKEKTVTDNVDVNKWVHQTMKEYYLWSHTLGEYQTSNLSPSDYLNKIRYRNNTTVAYEDDYYGDRFSRIDRKNTASRVGEVFDSSGNYVNDFGFGFISVVDKNSNIWYCQVAYVVPGSPAEKAGVKRGFKFDAMKLGQNSYEMPMSREKFLSVYENRTVEFNFYYPEGVDIPPLTRASYMDTPIIFHDVYQTGNTKTAYLVYNHFSSGHYDGAYQDGAFNVELKKVFADFKRQGATNLILDLRYNGGGELSAAVLLGSLIVSTADQRKPFVYLERNKHRGMHYSRFDHYIFTNQTDNLGVQKLYILTLNFSASASELILHCLKPYFGDNLQHVGMKTYGKNVGSNLITNSSYEWTISPITMRVYDKNGVSGYETGIRTGPGYPNTHETGEDYVEKSELVIGDFGDDNELMFSQVMHHIQTGTWPAQGRSSQSSPTRAITEGLSTELSGMRVTGLTEDIQITP